MGLALVCIIGQQWFAYHERFSLSLLVAVLIAGTSLIALSLIFYLPFYLTFISPAQGIGLVSAQSRSMLSDELLIFGLFAFIFLSLLLVSAMKQPLFGRSQEDALGPNRIGPLQDRQSIAHPAIYCANCRDPIYRVRYAPTYTAPQSSAHPNQGMNSPTFFGAWAEGFSFSDKLFILHL